MGKKFLSPLELKSNGEPMRIHPWEAEPENGKVWFGKESLVGFLPKFEGLLYFQQILKFGLRPLRASAFAFAPFIFSEFAPSQIRFFNGDDPTDRELLSDKSLEFLENLRGHTTAPK